MIQQLHLCGPSVVGLSIGDAEARLKEVEDEVLEQLHCLGERLEERNRKKHEWTARTRVWFDDEESLSDERLSTFNVSIGNLLCITTGDIIGK
jgi:hypothetical protein